MTDVIDEEGKRKQAAEKAIQTLIERHKTEFLGLLSDERERFGLESPAWHPLLVDSNFEYN